MEIGAPIVCLGWRSAGLLVCLHLLSSPAAQNPAERSIYLWHLAPRYTGYYVAPTCLQKTALYDSLVTERLGIRISTWIGVSG